MNRTSTVGVRTYVYYIKESMAHFETIFMGKLDNGGISENGRIQSRLLSPSSHSYDPQAVMTCATREGRRWRSWNLCKILFFSNFFFTTLHFLPSCLSREGWRSFFRRGGNWCERDVTPSSSFSPTMDETFLFCLSLPLRGGINTESGHLKRLKIMRGGGEGEKGKLCCLSV